jgi:hypothetical protein
MTEENNIPSDAPQATVDDPTVVCDVQLPDDYDAPTPIEETIDEVMQRYNVAQNMHRKLNDKYVGMKVAIHQPLAGSTSGDVEEVTESFGDNARVILNTFPSYITDLGKSIAGKARNLVRDNSAKVPSTNGYLVHKDKIDEIEAGLLSYKGITPADHHKYDAETIQDAQNQISIRMANRKGVYRDKNIPVTFLEYCQYVRDNFDQLIIEILAEYGENAYKIENSLPKRASVDKASFDWYHFAEVPALMMYGETSLRDIINGMRREEQAEQKIKAKVESEILRFQDQCQDAVTTVQNRVRSEIAGQLRDFVEKVDQDRTYTIDGEQITRPRNITNNNLTKLTTRIDSLTSEISGVADNDEFYRTVQEFKNQLTIGPDMTDEEVRNTTRDNAQRIIEMSMDRSQVDRNTGQYFASIL